MTQEVKIPNDRIGAIIGKHGDTRKNLEKLLNVTLEVDSRDGLVTITIHHSLYRTKTSGG